MSESIKITKEQFLSVYDKHKPNLFLRVIYKDFYDRKYEENKDSELYKMLGLIKGYKKPKTVKNLIYVVYRSNDGFAKKGFNVKKIKVNLDDNYNDDFQEISKKIITGLNDKHKSNLVILHGVPRTGKCVVSDTVITIRNKKTGIIKQIKIGDLI